MPKKGVNYIHCCHVVDLFLFHNSWVWLKEIKFCNCDLCPCPKNKNLILKSFLIVSCLEQSEDCFVDLALLLYCWQSPPMSPRASPECKSGLTVFLLARKEIRLVHGQAEWTPFCASRVRSQTLAFPPILRRKGFISGSVCYPSKALVRHDLINC